MAVTSTKQRTNVANETGAVDPVYHHSQLVVDSLTNQQPVELAQQRACVAPPQCLQNNPSGVVLHAL